MKIIERILIAVVVAIFVLLLVAVFFDERPDVCRSKGGVWLERVSACINPAVLVPLK